MNDFEFLAFLARNPEAGVVIPGTGGVRKIRWGLEKRGKRGGARVIYYYYRDDRPLYLLAAYGKNEQSDLSEDTKAALRRFVQSVKASAET